MPTATTITISATSPAAASGAGGGAGTSVTVLSAVGVTAVGDYLSGYQSMRVTATVLGATGGTLDVYLQVSYDGGTTWADYAHYTQLTDGQTPAAVWASSHSRAKGQALAARPLVSLAANSAIDGCWGTQARLWFVSGAGTSAGAVQTVVLHLEGLRTSS